MKRFKSIAVAGTLVLSLSAITGCTAHYGYQINDEKVSHDYEYDDDEGKFVEVNKDDDDDSKEAPEEKNGKNDDEKPQTPDEKPESPEKTFGYDSTEDVITAYWQAFEDCSREEFETCFLSEDMISSSAYKKMAELIDNQVSVAEKNQDIAVIHLSEFTISSKDVDPEDLASHVTAIIDVDKAEISQVCLPMTQEFDGVTYEVNDNYEFTTICVDGRWYIDTLDSTGADVVSTGNTPVNAGGTSAADRSGWGTFTITNDSIKSVYSKGINDSYELVDGVTFGDLCDAFEDANADFNRETFRQVFTLTFGPDLMYNAMIGASANEKAYAFACAAEIAHTIDKVEGKATEMKLELSDPEFTVYNVSCKTYGECILYVNNTTNDMKLVQTKTGNESEGSLKDDDIAAWEAAAREILEQ